VANFGDGNQKSKSALRLPISITEIGHRSDFKPLKSVTCPISADREFSIEIRSVANLKIENLEIVNKTTNHVDFVKILMPAHRNYLYGCNPK
jgi:hypothetical protein